jgi:hypothetical protein
MAKLFPWFSLLQMKFRAGVARRCLWKSRQALTRMLRPQETSGRTMRRRLELFIPIVVLAVLVQLIAPIAAFRVVAYATSDPLYLASICTETSSSSAAQTAPAKTQHDHGECCAFCGAGHGASIAFASPPLIFVTLQRQYQQISWLEAADPMPTIRVGSNTQARAPPSLS